MRLAVAKESLRLASYQHVTATHLSLSDYIFHLLNLTVPAAILKEYLQPCPLSLRNGVLY